MTPRAIGGEALRLHDVHIALPGRVLVERLSIEVAPGEALTVMGPSGVGKSSLLAYIGGHLQAVVHMEGPHLPWPAACLTIQRSSCGEGTPAAEMARAAGRRPCAALRG